MNQAAASPEAEESAETALRESLADADATAATVAPVMRHLLAGRDNSLFGDEIVARVRGMNSDVARQLSERLGGARDSAEPPEHDAALLATLADTLIASPAFLGHIHALALEWQLTERLQSRLAFDPVLPPLMQALIASPDETTAALAMKLLAAQARFCQAQRRMQLPLDELPGDLLHGALIAMRTIAATNGVADERTAAAESAIRLSYDEGRNRLGLMARLVSDMGGGSVAALSVHHAGVAIFLSALATAARLDRDLVALSTSESQHARLALALRAAGLKPASVVDELLAIHTECALPAGFDRLGVDRAAAVLAVASSHPGG